MGRVPVTFGNGLLLLATVAVAVATIVAVTVAGGMATIVAVTVAGGMHAGEVSRVDPLCSLVLSCLGIDFLAFEGLPRVVDRSCLLVWLQEVPGLGLESM